MTKIHRAGGIALRDLNVTVVMTGDEEDAGDPLEIARRDLVEAARQSDVALAFEGGNRGDATVARRGASGWRLTTTGRQAHSAGVFGQGAGYGAIYEMARILDAFRSQLSGEQYLTFNVATVVGGTDVTYDSMQVAGTTASKTNIVPRLAVAEGDLRFISEEQKERARQRMRADYLRVTSTSPPADVGATYEDIIEAYDRGGLPYERTLTRLSYGRWLLSQNRLQDARAVNTDTLDLARRFAMRIMEADAWLIEAEPGLAGEIFLDLDPDTGIPARAEQVGGGYAATDTGSGARLKPGYQRWKSSAS